MPPSYIQLGPLTRTIANRARWLYDDKFPACQEWADEIERVLQHIYVNGKFDEFLPRLRDVDAKQRDAKLAEARVSFFFHRNSFRILAYDPPGSDGSEGDLLIQWGDTAPIFVEVKAPSWRGELFPRTEEAKRLLTPVQREWILNRLRKPKDIDLEARWVDPAGQALDVVGRNALKKFFDDRPNLVVVADDFFVTAVGLPTLDAIAKAEMADPEYNRVGGILFFKPECYDAEIEYRIQYVDNPKALSSCSLPNAVRQGFTRSTAQQKQPRRRRYGAGLRGFFNEGF
jgi:hypothetical protein